MNTDRSAENEQYNRDYDREGLRELFDRIKTKGRFHARAQTDR